MPPGLDGGQRASEGHSDRPLQGSVAAGGDGAQHVHYRCLKDNRGREFCLEDDEKLCAPLKREIVSMSF